MQTVLCVGNAISGNGVRAALNGGTAVMLVVGLVFSSVANRRYKKCMAMYREEFDRAQRGLQLQIDSYKLDGHKHEGP